MGILQKYFWLHINFTIKFYIEFNIYLLTRRIDNLSLNEFALAEKTFLLENNLFYRDLIFLFDKEILSL